MISLYILGFLAFCYLFFGRAGFMGFWYVMRWPTTILFGFLLLLDIHPYGLNSFVLFVVALLFTLFYEKLPEWFWDLMNLVMFLIVAGVGIYILAEVGLIT